MPAAYYRAFESKHPYFHTGRAHRWISRCARKRRIVRDGEAASITDPAHQIFERVIDERIIERLGLFDRSDEGFARYGISLDLENEDGEWNVEVTVSMEF